MMLVGSVVYYRGWQCDVLHQQKGVIMDGDGIRPATVLTISRIDQGYPHGGIGIGTVEIDDPELFIPPSTFKSQYTDFYEGFIGSWGDWS